MSNDKSTKTKWFNWKNWGINIAIVLVAYLAIQAFHTRDAPTSGAAPPLSGITLDGQSVELKKLRGKPVLLHFWATWCGICRLEYDSIDQLAEHYQVITVVSQSGTRSAVRSHVKKEGISAPVLVDSSGHLSKRYGIKGFPTTFFINPAGNISDVEVGYSTYWGLKLRLWWAGL